MRNLLIAGLAVGLLWSCGDKKSDSKESADNNKVTLESESDRLSYAMGVSNGASIRESIEDPQQGISDHVNYSRIVSGCQDGFGDDIELTPEELQRVSSEFMAKLDMQGEISKELTDNFSYFIGVNVTKNTMQQMNMLQADSMFNSEMYAAGFKAGILDETALMSREDGEELVKNFMNDQQKKMMDAAQAEAMKEYPIHKAEGEAFLEENKKKPGVKTTESGLQYEIIKSGSGPKPNINNSVVAHYTGTTLDGTIFDSSVERGEPAEFPLQRVIAGWTEALQMMSVGSKWKLYIPEELAYGKQPPPNSEIKAGMTLIFEVELIDIK